MATPDEPAPGSSEYETLRHIQASLQLLTGGCEICQHSVGAFCKKHRRSFNPGDPRCVDFLRRFPENPTKASRAQAQDYVNEVLGIRDERLVKRLTGYD